MEGRIKEKKALLTCKRPPRDFAKLEPVESGEEAIINSRRREDGEQGGLEKEKG